MLRAGACCAGIPRTCDDDLGHPELSQEILEELEGLRREVGELSERVDFAERLLMKPRDEAAKDAEPQGHYDAMSCRARPRLSCFGTGAALPSSAAASAAVSRVREPRLPAGRGSRHPDAYRSARAPLLAATRRVSAAGHAGPDGKAAEGRGQVRYVNNSPDTLRVVYFHLYQNLFAPDGVRNQPLQSPGAWSWGASRRRGAR